MDIPLFDFLEGLSPWWWVAFAITLGAIEMATMSFFLIWPGIAALAMAVIVTVAPGMPGELQIAVFAALSVIATFGGRALMRIYGDGAGPVSTLNDRTGQMLGRRGTILSAARGEATVVIDGVHWRGTLPDGIAPPADGTQVEVIGAEGMILQVRPVG